MSGLGQVAAFHVQRSIFVTVTTQIGQSQEMAHTIHQHACSWTKIWNVNTNFKSV